MRKIELQKSFECGLTMSKKEMERWGKRNAKGEESSTAVIC